MSAKLPSSRKKKRIQEKEQQINVCTDESSSSDSDTCWNDIDEEADDTSKVTSTSRDTDEEGESPGHMILNQPQCPVRTSFLISDILNDNQERVDESVKSKTKETYRDDDLPDSDCECANIELRSRDLNNDRASSTHSEGRGNFNAF